MIYPIILAGGSGTRFWPLSRRTHPKQFLNICSDTPLIEQTIKRILGLTERKNIFIATNAVHHKNIKGCLKQLNINQKNVLFEPESRNTLAPIGLLTKKIYLKDKKAIILVMPSDHYIKDEAKFLKSLKKAINVASKGYIVTLGVVPDSPETGYGYIKVKSRHKDFFLIDRFIEKPDILRAKSFFKNRKFFWNAGIFIFRADVMLGEIEKFESRDFGIISKINSKASLSKLWQQITSISIDYAIMERTKKMALIPADFGWMDLGSWEAIERFSVKDKDGNVFKGNCIDIGSRGITAWARNRLLATLGLRNVIIVDTEDALLVCAKDKAQEVKKIVQILKRKNSKQI